MYIHIKNGEWIHIPDNTEIDHSELFAQADLVVADSTFDKISHGEPLDVFPAVKTETGKCPELPELMGIPVVFNTEIPKVKKGKRHRGGKK